jgi:predicted nucleic acid-binding protein
MARFVIDASVVMAWCFEDETTPYADAVLDRFAEDTALAPGIWPLEVGNVLVLAERRGRMSNADSIHFLKLLRQLRIEVDLSTAERMFDTVFNLAREQTISTYDAAYLDLAMQTGLPLATLDTDLRKAATQCGVDIFLDEGR